MCVATPAAAQDVQPVLNARLSVPMGLMLETGFFTGKMYPEGMAGPSLTVGAGTGGGQVSVGYRALMMMGLNGALQAVAVRTWGDPVGAPSRQTYAGVEARGGILLMSAGLGVLVRVGGEQPGGSRVRLMASVGVGL